jgi:PAS fold
VGGPTGNGATEATASSPARAPALALVDGHGDVIRLTETFRAGFAPDGSPHLSIWDFLADPDQRSRLGRVLEGALPRADLALPSAAGSVAADAQAVLDAAVMRHALLTVAPAGPDPEPRSGADVLLGEPSLDASPAIVWIKDLSGRYLRINQRYAERLGIDDASIRGKSDAELAPAHVVAEPRLSGHQGSGGEPAQIEYTVEASAGRDALTVLRFPIHDRDGAAVAVCGVASALATAGTARSEAERLLRIERWAGLSVAAIRAEVLEEWQLAEVQAEPPAAAEAPTTPAPLAEARPTPDPERTVAAQPTPPAVLAELERLRGELQAAYSAIAQLEARLGEERAAKTDIETILAAESDRRAELDERLAAVTSRADELASGAVSERSQIAEVEAALAAERARAEGLAAEVADARARAEMAQREVADARARAETAQREIADARAQTEGAERETGDARARAQAAEREVAAARARAEAAEQEVASERARAEAAEREVAAARARAEAAMREVASERARALELEDGRTGGATLERELAGQRGRAEKAERDVAALRVRAENAERDVTALRVRAESAERDVALERERTDELERAGTAVAAAVEQAGAEHEARVDLEERLAESQRRAEDAEQRLAAGLADTEQTRGELGGRAERAEDALTEERAASERAAAAAERANALAEISRSRAEGLETALTTARTVEAENRTALERARSEIASLQSALETMGREKDAEREAAREAAERLERELREATDRLERERREATDRLERERRVAAEPSPSMAAVSGPLVRPPGGAPVPSLAARSSAGPTWSHGAQRALAASLAGATEWRAGLKDVVRVLGAEGRWDVVVAWCPDERATRLRCVAMWMAAPGELSLFETATWQRRQLPTSTAAGRAAVSDHAHWIEDLAGVDDAQLAAAAGVGMRAALHVPIRHGGETSGVLELLTRVPATSDPELACAMEAAALQLAHFEYLLRRGAEPRWGLGRL